MKLVWKAWDFAAWAYEPTLRRRAGLITFAVAVWGLILVNT
jgi:hypothetical protein